MTSSVSLALTLVMMLSCVGIGATIHGVGATADRVGDGVLAAIAIELSYRPRH